jgi:hypothetical protein
LEIQCNEPSLGGFEPNGKPEPKSPFWECKKIKNSNLVIKVTHHPKNNPNNNNNNSNKIIKFQ